MRAVTEILLGCKDPFGEEDESMIAHTSDEYRAAVAGALTGANEAPVFNGTMDHARVVIEEAFKAAKSRVRILTNKLSPACYGSQAIIDAASAFLADPRARLDILVEDASALHADHPFLAKARLAGGDRVRTLTVPPEYVAGYTFNFMTVDDNAYRFESDRTKPTAVVAGGPANRAVVAHLAGLFDQLFADSSPAELTLQAVAG